MITQAKLNPNFINTNPAPLPTNKNIKKTEQQTINKSGMFFDGYSKHLNYLSLEFSLGVNYNLSTPTATIKTLKGPKNFDLLSQDTMTLGLRTFVFSIVGFGLHWNLEKGSTGSKVLEATDENYENNVSIGTVNATATSFSYDLIIRTPPLVLGTLCTLQSYYLFNFGSKTDLKYSTLLLDPLEQEHLSTEEEKKVGKLSSTNHQMGLRLNIGDFYNAHFRAGTEVYIQYSNFDFKPSNQIESDNFKAPNWSMGFNFNVSVVY